MVYENFKAEHFKSVMHSDSCYFLITDFKSRIYIYIYNYSGVLDSLEVEKLSCNQAPINRQFFRRISCNMVFPAYLLVLQQNNTITTNVFHSNHYNAFA
jgi:hypothetical protein